MKVRTDWVGKTHRGSAALKELHSPASIPWRIFLMPHALDRDTFLEIGVERDGSRCVASPLQNVDRAVF